MWNDSNIKNSRERRIIEITFGLTILLASSPFLVKIWTGDIFSSEYPHGVNASELITASVISATIALVCLSLGILWAYYKNQK